MIFFLFLGALGAEEGLFSLLLENLCNSASSQLSFLHCFLLLEA